MADPEKSSSLQITFIKRDDPNTRLDEGEDYLMSDSLMLCEMLDDEILSIAMRPAAHSMIREHRRLLEAPKKKAEGAS